MIATPVREAVSCHRPIIFTPSPTSARCSGVTRKLFEDGQPLLVINAPAHHEFHHCLLVGMIDGLTSASALSNLSCWLPNISLKTQALKLENPVFRIHHSGPFILCCKRIVRIKVLWIVRARENPGLLWPRLHLFGCAVGRSGWLELVDSKDQAWSPCFARYHDLSGHTRSFARRVGARVPV